MDTGIPWEQKRSIYKHMDDIQIHVNLFKYTDACEIKVCKIISDNQNRVLYSEHGCNCLLNEFVSSMKTHYSINLLNYNILNVDKIKFYELGVVMPVHVEDIKKLRFYEFI